MEIMVSIAFYCKLYKKLHTDTNILKKNGDQLTPYIVSTPFLGVILYSL